MGMDRTNVGLRWVEDDVEIVGFVFGRATTCMHAEIPFGDADTTAVATRFNGYVSAAGASRAAFDAHLAADMSTTELVTWNGQAADAQDDAFEAYRKQHKRGWTL